MVFRPQAWPFARSAGNCGPEREVYAQQVTWSRSGLPELGGEPVPLTTPLRESAGDPGSP